MKRVTMINDISLEYIFVDQCVFPPKLLSRQYDYTVVNLSFVLCCIVKENYQNIKIIYCYGNAFSMLDSEMPVHMEVTLLEYLV